MWWPPQKLFPRDVNGNSCDHQRQDRCRIAHGGVCSAYATASPGRRSTRSGACAAPTGAASSRRRRTPARRGAAGSTPRRWRSACAPTPPRSAPRRRCARCTPADITSYRTGLSMCKASWGAPVWGRLKARFPPTQRREVTRDALWTGDMSSACVNRLAFSGMRGAALPDRQRHRSFALARGTIQIQKLDIFSPLRLIHFSKLNINREEMWE